MTQFHRPWESSLRGGHETELGYSLHSPSHITAVARLWNVNAPVDQLQIDNDDAQLVGNDQGNLRPLGRKRRGMSVGQLDQWQCVQKGWREADQGTEHWSCLGHPLPSAAIDNISNHPADQLQPVVRRLRANSYGAPLSVPANGFQDFDRTSAQLPYLATSQSNGSQLGSWQPMAKSESGWKDNAIAYKPPQLANHLLGLKSASSLPNTQPMDYTRELANREAGYAADSVSAIAPMLSGYPHHDTSPTSGLTNNTAVPMPSQSYGERVIGRRRAYSSPHAPISSGGSTTKGGRWHGLCGRPSNRSKKPETRRQFVEFVRARCMRAEWGPAKTPIYRLTPPLRRIQGDGNDSLRAMFNQSQEALSTAAHPRETISNATAQVWFRQHFGHPSIMTTAAELFAPLPSSDSAIAIGDLNNTLCAKSSANGAPSATSPLAGSQAVSVGGRSCPGRTAANDVESLPFREMNL